MWQIAVVVVYLQFLEGKVWLQKITYTLETKLQEMELELTKKPSPWGLVSNDAI